MAAHHHKTACTAASLDGYTLKDPRHSIAVRMMKAGYTVAEIAEQLGNSPELVARVYAVHTPNLIRRATSHATSLTEGHVLLEQIVA